MSWLRRIRRWFGAIICKHELDAGMDEEMHAHLELRTQEFMKEGMTPEKARLSALRRFGGMEQIKEACRDQRGAGWLEDLFQDARFGVRALRKNPGFTGVAVVSLALAIGAGTAVFSHVNAVLLRSLPVPNPQELRVVEWSGNDVRMTSFEGTSTREGNRWKSADCVPHPTFLNLRQEAAELADVFGFCPIREAVVRMGGEVFVAQGMMVSENFFSGLKTQPGLGRLLLPGDDFAGAMNVVISYRWWQRYFGLDPSVIGRAFVLDRTSFTVVGVLPKGFPGVRPADPGDFYVPMAAASPFLYRPMTEDFHWFVRLMARMRPGTSDSQLKACLTVAFARQVGKMMKAPEILVEPGRGGLRYDRNAYGKPLLLMLGVVGLVLLVACANLAGLSLARGAACQHELAVRASLGAGRWRLARQSLTESLVLALLGGALGVLIAFWGRSLIARLLTGSLNGLRTNVPLDLTVLGFGLGIVLLTALLSGLPAALRAGRVNPLDGLRSRGTLSASRLRMGKFLVTAQISLSLLLLAGAGLYLRTILNLTHVNAGFAVETLVLVELDIRAGTYAQAHPADFYQRVEDDVASVPGVQSATVMAFPLLADLAWTGGFDIAGHVLDSPANANRLSVGTTFFTTLGIPILQGRGFEPQDSADAPKVLVVNESFVRRFLADANPIGLTCKILGAEWRIVGVCRDAKYDNIKKPVEPTTYFPLRQMFLSPSLSKNLNTACVAVRTALAPSVLSTVLRKTITSIDSTAAITKITTQEQVRDAGITQEFLLAKLCALLASVAVVLSCIGLYGLMAYNVARRTSEIAIRMAVGAHPRDIARSILTEAFGLAALGIGIGLPAALAATRLIKSQLFGVQPNDPTILVLGLLVLLAVALVAAWLPARRAARVDPMVALRTQ